VKVLQSVVSTSDALKKRVEALLDMVVSTVSSLSESFLCPSSSWNEEGPLEKKADELAKGNAPGTTESEGSDLTEEGDLEVHA
jgi:cleavage and polyadenylation specificity factor subunit 3